MAKLANHGNTKASLPLGVEGQKEMAAMEIKKSFCKEISCFEVCKHCSVYTSFEI